MREVKKRILWVDIAKALAILSVPISHTIMNPSTLRTVLFSFHMPLFFILSGFTTKLATDWGAFKKRLAKNYFYLLVPAFMVLMIYSIIYSIKTGFGIAEVSIMTFGRTFGLVGFDVHPEILTDNVASVWFFLVLFLAKTLMDLINVMIKSEKNGLIFGLLGLLGIFLGIYDGTLYLHFDLVLTAMLFIELGILWKKYEKIVKKCAVLLLIFCCCFWFMKIMRNEYLEFWMRSYPGNIESILEAAAGTFIICNLAMMFEESFKKAKKVQKKIVNSLILIGQKTMLFLLIHCLDGVLFSWLWDQTDGATRGSKWFYLSALIRLSIDLIVFATIMGVKRLFTPVKEHRRP